MKVNGKYTLNATPDVLWKLILDPQILEKITPGIKNLVQQGTDSYKAISDVKIGPVRGTFEGELSIKDKVTNESCVLVVDQKSKMGNVVAEIEMKFVALENDVTEIIYVGEARISGMLARTGQRIMSGVVSTLSKQFFQALEKELQVQQDV